MRLSTVALFTRAGIITIAHIPLRIPAQNQGVVQRDTCAVLLLNLEACLRQRADFINYE